MPMYFYSDGTQSPVGPIAVDRLHQLHREGTLHTTTPVIEAGGTTWQTYGDFAYATSAPPPARARSGPVIQGVQAGSFLNFEKMLAPRLIKLIYFIGLIAIGIALLVVFFGGLSDMRNDATSGLGKMILAILGAALSFLVWRVVCEMWILLFSIYDRLGEIRDQARARAG